MMFLLFNILILLDNDVSCRQCSPTHSSHPNQKNKQKLKAVLENSNENSNHAIKVPNNIFIAGGHYIIMLRILEILHFPSVSFYARSHFSSHRRIGDELS